MKERIYLVLGEIHDAKTSRVSSDIQSRHDA